MCSCREHRWEVDRIIPGEPVELIRTDPLIRLYGNDVLVLRDTDGRRVNVELPARFTWSGKWFLLSVTEGASCMQYIKPGAPYTYFHAEDRQPDTIALMNEQGEQEVIDCFLPPEFWHPMPLAPESDYLPTSMTPEMH